VTGVVLGGLLLLFAAAAGDAGSGPAASEASGLGPRAGSDPDPIFCEA